MEKSAPGKHPAAKHPEQLALPLEESTPPTPERKDVCPWEVWRTLETRSRASVKERWVRVMREAASNARD
jgi:hypothetical protein